MTFLRRRAADRIAGARPFANRISAERGAACAARLAANRRARGFSAAKVADFLSVAGAKALLFLVARARLCCAAARCATVLILNAGACLMRAVFCVLNPPNPPCQGGEAARRLAAACCATALALTVGTAVAAVQERALFIGAPAAATVFAGESRLSTKTRQVFKIAAVGNVPLQQKAGTADDWPVTAPAAESAPPVTPATPGLQIPTGPASASSPASIIVAANGSTNNKSHSYTYQNCLKDAGTDQIKSNACKKYHSSFNVDCLNEFTAWEVKEFKENTDEENNYNKCEQKQRDLNEYGKCSNEIEEKYKTAEKVPENEDCEDEDGNLSNKTECKAAREAARELTKCMQEQEYDKGNKTCKEEAKEVKEALKDFREECSSFVGSPLDCQRALDSCEQCDGALSGEVSGDDVDCVLIRNQGICPELASGHLKDLKEERKDYEKKIEELQKKLEDLKQERGRLEGELNDEKLQFQAEAEKMKREEEELRESLEEGLKSAKGEIDAAMKTAVAKARAEMEKTHQMQFELSNAIEAAHRKRRDSKQKVYSECKAKATERLSAYRNARRAAIRQGRFRKESIMQMLSQNRLTFADKDDIKFSRYYFSCLSQNKYLLQSIDEDLRVNLTKIDQQKQLIVRQLESLNRQAAALAAEADAKQKAVADDYVARLTKITHKSKRNLDSRVRVYNQKSGHLGNQISKKDEEIRHTAYVLQQTKMTKQHNQELYHNLRAAGGSEKDKSSELSDASRAQGNLRDTLEPAVEACGCEKGCDYSESAECKTIKNAGRLVESDHSFFSSRENCGGGSSSSEGGSSGEE